MIMCYFYRCLLCRPGSQSTGLHEHRVLWSRVREKSAPRHHQLHSTFVHYSFFCFAYRL